MFSHNSLPGNYEDIKGRTWTWQVPEEKLHNFIIGGCLTVYEDRTDKIELSFYLSDSGQKETSVINRGFPHIQRLEFFSKTHSKFTGIIT